MLPVVRLVNLLVAGIDILVTEVELLITRVLTIRVVAARYNE